MASPKLVILLVHGAYSTPEMWGPIIPKLESLSYEVVTVALPSSSLVHTAAKTLPDDIAEIRKVIVPHIEEGKEVILVAHSYGGVPGCASIEGYSVVDREKSGKKGGFKAALFISALTPSTKNGSAAITYAKESVDWVEPEMTKAGPIGVPTTHARRAFFDDLPDAEADKYFAMTRKTSLMVMLVPANYVASDLEIPHTYMICEKDLAIFLEDQERIVAGIPTLKTVRIDTGHFPWLTQTDRVVEIIGEVARE